jgi:hypothetical protein
MKLMNGLNKINRMIGGNVTEKSVPRWRLERIAEELGGEIHYQEVLDSQGRKSKKIIITYREDD